VSVDGLPELRGLDEAITAAGPHAQVRTFASAGREQLPVHVVCLGTDAPDAPAVGFFGGVHGLERIGAQVVIAWLRNIAERLPWDEVLRWQLEHLRLVFMPLVNPAGMLRGTRANANGVDLMRNSPVHASDRVPPLVGGQRISAGLPWYRGRAADPMQPESAALCETVERELLGRPLALVLDCHSGFGLRDRIWFPFAHTRRPIEHLPELLALVDAFTGAHPNHAYVFEPQSRHYLAHGDLWDHLYLRSLDAGGILLPLTLEMGSWLWVRKNPRQLFSRVGIFNPLLEHRQARVLRRHLPLVDFLLRAAASHARWLPAQDQREALRQAARSRWYEGA
jgi:hypothetical protein